MKYIIGLIFFAITVLCQSQNMVGISGVVKNALDDKVIENVNIVNLNEVSGTITNKHGEFEINVKPDDTLYFSHLGFKPIKVRVSNDWIKFGNFEIKLTELADALEEVVISPFRLTGYLEYDIKQVKEVNNSYRYQIFGLQNTGYEAKSKKNNIISSILNPADFLYRVFGKKGRQLRKLKKIKEDDAIRDLLASRFDRETIALLLQISSEDLSEIINQCNYSESFINDASDLQLLDALSECYEDYKVLNNTSAR